MGCQSAPHPTRALCGGEFIQLAQEALPRAFIQESAQKTVVGEGEELRLAEPARSCGGAEVLGDVAAEIGRIVGVDGGAQA